jgi:hypothetical protein
MRSKLAAPCLRLGLQPFCVATRAKELGFVIAPSFDSALCVLRERAATRTLEMLFLGLWLRKKPSQNREE